MHQLQQAPAGPIDAGHILYIQRDLAVRMTRSNRMPAVLQFGHERPSQSPFYLKNQTSVEVLGLDFHHSGSAHPMECTVSANGKTMKTMGISAALAPRGACMWAPAKSLALFSFRVRAGKISEGRRDRLIYCGGREGGMIISRSPNNRASIEKAPGPRTTTAVAITATKANTNLDGVAPPSIAGMIDAEVAAAMNPTAAAAIGVIKPTSSKNPAAIANVPAIHVPVAGSVRPTICHPPSMSTPRPRAARSSNRPNPVRPSGKP